MRSLKINLYEFNELSEEAQKKAIEDNRYYNTEYVQWWDLIENEWIENLQIMGFEGVEISFTGFGSQGDGASFTSEGLNILTFLKDYPELKHKIRKSVLTLLEKGKIEQGYYFHKRYNNRYVHENSTNLDFLFDCNPNLSNGDNIMKYLNDIVNPFLNSKIVEINKEIYKELEKQYDYLTSDKVVKESLISNKIEFTENGTIYN